MAFRTRILEGEQGLHQAEAFFRRYQRLYIGTDVVESIGELARRWETDQAAATAVFGRKRRQWEQRGGYIEPLSVADISRWIMSRSYIVAEAAAPDSAEPAFDAVAQRVYRLPDSDWVIPRLDEAVDEVSHTQLQRAICEEGPGATGLVDFWGVLPEWAGSNVAAAARYAGMLEVIRRMADQPAASQVRRVVGLAFAIQGLQALDPDVTDPTNIRLADFGQEEVVNRASLTANTLSRRCPAQIVGKWRNAPPVPVAAAGRRYALDVHWYYYAHRLDDVVLVSGEW